MQQPLEQDITLRQMLTGMSRAEVLREFARRAVAEELLHRRAAAGDRTAIDQIRTEQRGLARMLARKQAQVEAQVSMLIGLSRGGS